MYDIANEVEDDNDLTLKITSDPFNCAPVANDNNFGTDNKLTCIGTYDLESLINDDKDNSGNTAIENLYVTELNAGDATATVTKD